MEASRKAFVQNAFQVFTNTFVIIVVCRCVAFLEEVGRRHLLRVADDDQLLAAGDHADGIPLSTMTALVSFSHARSIP